MFYKKIFFTVFFLLFSTKVFAFRSAEDVLTLGVKERLLLDKNEIFPLLAGMKPSEKVAFWAEFFVGTPYDPEMIGNYVKEGVIVLETSLDCMSHTFRSFELAHAENEETALEKALYFRFPKKGMRSGNKIISYENRFEYGEDMALSGKFGRVVSGKISGLASAGKTTRQKHEIYMLETENALLNLAHFQTGDTIFFVKNPTKRKGLEIVGHIGILKSEGGKLFLIHASGTKNKGGEVKKVDFESYLKANFPFFNGIIVTRI